MFTIKNYNYTTKKDYYEELLLQGSGLVFGEKDTIANMANISALIFNTMNDINWAGFYRVVDKELVLGPFQGKPACIRIAIGKGVCGTAVDKAETQVVKDVDQFVGHIPCDDASKSEIVIPMIVDNIVVGVLDIDSPILNRFDEEDKLYLEKLVQLLVGE